MYSHDGDTHLVEHKRYGWRPGRMLVDGGSQVPDFGIVHKSTAISTFQVRWGKNGRSGVTNRRHCAFVLQKQAKVYGGEIRDLRVSYIGL